MVRTIRDLFVVTCGGLDSDHSGHPGPGHGEPPGVVEQVMDADGLRVVIRLGEVLQHLGPVVHVNLGCLLDIVLGHDQLLVQTPGAGLPPAVPLSLGRPRLVPLRELQHKLLPDRRRQTKRGGGRRGQRQRRARAVWSDNN